ncbi:MAG: endonuclease III [bacterium]|nr:endonuclease III [bacterium]
MDRIELLSKIEAMSYPLNPPVLAFEKSIRKTPFRILVSVLLSSRTRDPVTHKASEQLFAAADSPAEMAALDEARITELIYPVGFYKQKARNIKILSQMLVDSGETGIPTTLEGLTALPGVGRKTGNLVLALAFDVPAIAVDIHVFRISQRLGWASSEKYDEIEKQLMAGFDKKQWNRINQTLVGFGQTLCKPVSPLCDQCTITSQCVYFESAPAEGKE